MCIMLRRKGGLHDKRRQGVIETAAENMIIAMGFSACCQEL